MMKKFMKKLWDKRDSKKGFTLVELIVVLVILAILAAIMVPALLGWIDKAKEKQAVLEARNVYMAAQTEASAAYASKTTLDGSTYFMTDKVLADIKLMADNDDITSIIAVMEDTSKDTSKHDCYKIKSLTVEFIPSGEADTVVAKLNDAGSGTWVIEPKA